MKMIKYDFTANGIKEMENDSLDMIFSALDGTSKDFSIGDLDIIISIGDKQITVPSYAENFEMLFDFLKAADEENRL